jgi:thioredoxin 1
MNAPSAAVPLQVWCLCAAWCRTCDEYRPTFDAALDALGAGAAQRHWVDIEDEAALVGELDVEDFPTLLVARAGVPVFLGPLTPQPAVLARMLRSALDGALPPLADAAARAFVDRARTGAAVRG